jgi:glycosyltransferase involved in cell wall biosynthesis
MKILHTSIIEGIAGSENYLLKALPAINKLGGIEVTFVALTPLSKKSSEDKFVSILRDQGIKVEVIYYRRNYFSAAKKLSKVLKEGSVDILHSHLLRADVISSLVKRYYCKSIAHVSTKHGYEEAYNDRFGFDPAHKQKNKYWRIAKWAEAKVSCSYAISKGLQNLYIGLGICKSDKLKLIYYGFDFNFEASEKQTNRLFKMVMVGRLTRFKGHRYAIESCKFLKEEGVKFSLDIIGDGELDSALKTLVTSNGLDDHINFLGYQANGYEYMLEADTVLVPSVSEGFGVVVLEAMASKTAIVGFDVPAINETIVDEESGILVAPYDTKKYAQAIMRLIEDDELRLKLTKNAHKRLLTSFSLDRMIDETADFYSNLKL